MTAQAPHTRIDATFQHLREQGRKALVAFITAGDPSLETSQAILNGLPQAGADIIELGMPFTDPMADGPAIQLASQRALAAGQTMQKTLDMVRRFRERDDKTPIVLMGYYNPVIAYGNERFLRDAVQAGVDGLIIVDLPPEEDDELCLPALEAGLNFIRLATPTTDDARLPKVLKNATGFLYYVSITGVTGTRAPQEAQVAASVARIRRQTDIPVCIGFGVKTPEQAARMAALGDGVVVGSALVSSIAQAVEEGRGHDAAISAVHALTGALAESVHAVRTRADAATTQAGTQE